MSKIVIKQNAIQELKKYIKEGNFTKTVFLVDRKLKKLVSSFSNALIIDLISNEKTKSIESVYSIYSKLLQNSIDRNSLLVSVGGGVIGDTAGFVASTYMRGITWVQIPTTLLSQVDSSIGGKTAINHKEGKNMIGTFYQPSAVFSDVSLLETLPKRELTAGLAETMKYGFALDSYFFKECVSNYKKAETGNIKTLSRFVTKSVNLKTKIVKQDERDTKGIRQFLNFGHTLGHALEKYYNYKKLNHGEAVAVGMKFAVTVSYLKGMISNQDYVRSLKALNLIETPKLSKLNQKTIWQLMQKDKKNQSGQVKMVLLNGIGKAVANQSISYNEFKEALGYL